MKKLSIVLVTVVLCCSMFLFAGCDQAKTVENTDVIPSQYDLSKMQVGTTVDVYPPFRYKLLDRNGGEHIIKIKSFTLTFLKKNQIHEDDLLEGDFFNYEATMKITISADYTKFLTGDTLCMWVDNGSDFFGLQFKNLDNSFNDTVEQHIRVNKNNLYITFNQIFFD